MNINLKPSQPLYKIINVESLYQVIVVGLLLSILTAQIAILNRFSKPIDVDVQNKVEIQNSKPIDVNVQNKVARFGW